MKKIAFFFSIISVHSLLLAQGNIAAKKGTIDLNGEWNAKGYQCFVGSNLVDIPLEVVNINQSGNKITATKVQGDNCVPAGNTTFEGNYNSATGRYDIIWTTGTLSQPACCKNTTGSLEVISKDKIIVGSIILTRKEDYLKLIPECSDVPKEGDVIAYADGNNVIVHTGVVTRVVNGVVTEVESKWEQNGAQYKHTPGDTPYGQNWGIYHTNRPGGNLLKLDDDGTYVTDKYNQIVNVTFKIGNNSISHLHNAEETLKRYFSELLPLTSDQLTSPPKEDNKTLVLAYDWMYNCHGWTFTHGATGIDPRSVPLILYDNGYCRLVKQTK